MCQVSIFFLGAEVQFISVFPTWLPQHVTYDVIIINKTFYMSCRSYGENFVSIRQVVAEKDTSSVGANKQTDKQTRGHLGTNEYLRKRTQRIIMAEI